MPVALAAAPRRLGHAAGLLEEGAVRVRGLERAGRGGDAFLKLSVLLI